MDYAILGSDGGFLLGGTKTTLIKQLVCLVIEILISPKLTHSVADGTVFLMQHTILSSPDRIRLSHLGWAALHGLLL